MQQEGLIPRWLLPAAIAGAALLLALAIIWFVLLRPAIQSTAQQAAANAPAVQAANANAKQALNKVNGLTPNVSATAAPGIAGPNGGPAYSSRLAVTNDNRTSSLTVPDGGNWAVTDLVFENPGGSSGSLEWKRGNEVLLKMRLENFRDLDFHFITPQVFKEKQSMTLTCTPDQGSTCEGAVYYTGFFKNPPGS